MEEGEENLTKKKRVVVESLGWLTESTIMPKKHKAIQGVGASSILELKAQLYRTQEEARNAKELAPDVEFHRAKKKIVNKDVLDQKNSGVDARNNKDKLELKAVNDGSVGYAALEKKAELYEKLQKGELPDEEDKEKYCVDFFSKSLVRDDSSEKDDRDFVGPSSVGSLEKGEDDVDPFALFNKRAVGSGRSSGVADNEEHKRFVREVHEEANQERSKVSELKLRRQEQVNARREKLKQAYLRKQLEKAKAAAATSETKAPADP